MKKFSWLTILKQFLDRLDPPSTELPHTHAAKNEFGIRIFDPEHCAACEKLRAEKFAFYVNRLVRK